MFLQNIAKNFVVDIREEFFDIAFQDPDCPRMITRNLTSLIAEAIYRTVRAFDAPTRVRVENKFGVEVRIQYPVYGVMQKPVPNARFMNVTRFRIVDPECLIRSVLVGLVEKLAVQGENIVGQMK